MEEKLIDVQLFRAADKGKIKEVIKNLDAGANINYKDPYLRRTPLIIAAYSGHLNIVKLLIERGADIMAADHKQTNAVIAAAEAPKYQKDHVKIIDLLMSRGLNNKGTLNWAFYRAAESEKGITIKYLIEKGANINVKYEGSTALHEIAHSENRVLLKQFLKYNPDLTIKNKDGWTPLRLAMEYNRRATAKILRKHGAKE